MTSVAKAGVTATIGTILAPAVVVSAQGYEYDASVYVPEQVDNAHAFLTKHGYYEKAKEELIDFSGTRDEWTGGNFALGCHRLIFGGKNVPKLQDSSSRYSGDFPNLGQRTDYFGNDKHPVLGCATAALLNSSQGKVYEFELALKRGSRGFLERVSVSDKIAISQLVFLRKNRDYSTKQQHPWVGIDGIQRTESNRAFKISDPVKSTSWDYLDLKNANLQSPQYFVVWIEDKEKNEEQGKKDFFEGLGIRFSYNLKQFSSLVGRDADAQWNFRYYGHNQTKLNPSENYSDYKLKPEYTSKIASEISNLKGSWKDAKEFCNSQKEIKNRTFFGDDIQRLRDYCYIDQTQYLASINRKTK